MSPCDAVAPVASGRSDITAVALVDGCADLLPRLHANNVHVLDGNADLLLLGLLGEVVEVGTDRCTILLVRPDAGRSCLGWVSVNRGPTKRSPCEVVLHAPWSHRRRAQDSSASSI